MRSYYLNLNMNKAGKELKHIFDSTGDVIINFNGNNAYNNQEHIFVKPFGAFVSFMLDYIKVYQMEEMQKLFHVAVKEGIIEKLIKGTTYLIFVYEYSFKGIHDNRITSYIMVDFQNGREITLSEDDWKNLFVNMQASKKDVIIDDEVIEMSKTLADDLSEIQLEQLQNELFGNNDIKLVSRIEALKNLSQIRINKKEKELIGASLKDTDRIKRAILREKQKTEECIHILENKRKFISSTEYKVLMTL